MRVGLIKHIQENKHPAPQWHPETPYRMKHALQYLLESDIANEVDILNPREIDESCLKAVHDPEYLKSVENACRSGVDYLDGDTYLTSGSFDAARETAAAAIYAVDTIMSRKCDRIFLAGRPPGHHAEHNRGMGFCLINNVAVAAEAAIRYHGCRRVAIVDWDVHHGNGTQNIFYDRSDIYYMSLHRFPFYPGSGTESEQGRGEGSGYTLNIPLPPGSDVDIYMAQFKQKIIPELEKYKPELIVVSCGFDSHRDDPLGGMQMTEDGFGQITASLVEVAQRFSEGRIFSAFEGGYNPEANARSLYYHFRELQKN